MTPSRAFIALIGGVLLSAILHLMIGSTAVSPDAILMGIFGRGPSADIVAHLRGPRVAQCLVSGALLGLVGSAFQSLFRNPLSDPYVVGVSSGAAAGGALGFVLGFGSSWSGFVLGLGPTVFAAFGGAVALLLVMKISSHRGLIGTHTLLLSGVMVGSILSSLLSLILLWAGNDTNVVLRWLLGSMTPAFWNKVFIQLAVLVLGGGYLISKAKQMNVLALGDEAAQRLGIDVPNLKRGILTAGALMVAVSVGAIGIVGFLGLVGPHIARRMVGVDWRWSLPASGLAGASLLTLSDILAQRLVPGTEVPVGILTAIIGAPWLLVLLRKDPSTSYN